VVKDANKQTEVLKMCEQKKQRQLKKTWTVGLLFVALTSVLIVLSLIGYINSTKHLWASIPPEPSNVAIVEPEPDEVVVLIADKVVKGYNLFHSMLSGSFYDSIFQRAVETESEQDSDNDGIPDWTVLEIETNEDGFFGTLWVYDEGNINRYTCTNLQTPGKVWSGEFRIPDALNGFGQYELNITISTSEGIEQWQANIMVSKQADQGVANGSVSLTDLSGFFQINFSSSEPLVIDTSYPSFFVDGKGYITFVINEQSGNAILSSIDPENWQLWFDANNNGVIDSGEVVVIRYDYQTSNWLNSSKIVEAEIDY
jgi:hypothetical protein